MSTSTSYLPEDAMIEILAKLPVKSLIRFKCVCKSWYALIRNPSFITKHLNLSSSNNDSSRILLKHNISHKPAISLLSDETLDVSIDVAMPFFGDDTLNVVFYGPCDGIICLQVLSRGTQSREDQIVLWNPATGEFNLLPISGVPWPEGIGLLGMEIGFGLDLRTNDYKVVAILDFFNLETRSCVYPPQVEVYNLSTDSWRKIDVVVPTSVRAKLSFSSYWNGCYYWWAGDDDGVLSFDLSDEVFRMIPAPEMEDHSGVMLVKFNGSIALIVDNVEDLAYGIWVMNVDGVEKSWIKQFTLVHPLEFVRLEGVLKSGVALVRRDSDGKFALYDSSTQKCKDLRIPASKFPGWCQVVFYTESLVSVKGRNGLSPTG